jgi:hypothetical protein
MLSDEVDLNVVQQLRKSALAGISASQLLCLLHSLVKFPSTPHGRGIASTYFGVAFDWWVYEAKPLGAWHFFEGSNWSDEQIDGEFAPLLAHWKQGLSV